MVRVKRSPITRQQRTARIPSQKHFEILNRRLARNLARSINMGKLFDGAEPFKVDENGVVTNFDHSNPQHMKWLED